MSGGESQDTTFSPPDWTRDLYPQAMRTAVEMAGQQQPQYAGMRTAPMNAWQHGAGQLAVDRALYGDPQLNSSRGALMGITQGGAQNPYGQSQFLSNVANGGISNPYASNPYTNAMIAGNARDMTQAHQKGTAVQNDALAARGGGYGGSAWQEKQTADAGELSKRVGDMANQTRFQQNNLGAQLWQQDIGNALQATGLGSNIWQQDIGNIMQAAGMSPAFSQIDMQDIDRMGNYGGQQQNYLQSLLNESYNTWQGQQDYPYRQMDWLMGMLGQGSGQYGTRGWQGGGQSPLGMGLGAGLLGMGMLS